MSNDNQGGWPPPGQPTGFDPMTGQPIYAQPPQPPQPPQPTGFDPMTGQPIYGQPPSYPQLQQPYQPPQPPYQSSPQNPYAQPPPQNPYAQPPPQNPYAQPPPQNPYAQPPPMQYAHAQPTPYMHAQPMAYATPAPAAESLPGDLRASANATVGQSDRVRFIRLTYIHLFAAMGVFAGLLAALFKVPALVEHVSEPLTRFALGIDAEGYVTSSARWHWGVVLAVFMVVSWIADYWAQHASSKPLQYAGLLFYVVAEALIFVPLLMIVQFKTAEIIAKGGGDPNILRDSAFTTLAIFGALTASVIFSKKDFSFMRSGLAMMSAAAMMMVVLSLVFGFNLGIVFSVAMVVLAAGYILYQTSQVLAHYDPHQYVAASLALFSSVALMFWYVIRIFLRMRSQ